MLSLIAGGRAELRDTQGLCLNVVNKFWNTYEDEWLEDAFVRRLVREVEGINLNDNQTVLEALRAEGMAPEDMAGGVLALILIKFTDTLISMTRMGPNCYKYLFEICRQQDKRLALTGFCAPTNDDISGCPILFENTGALVSTQDEFVAEYDKVVNLLD